MDVEELAHAVSAMASEETHDFEGLAIHDLHLLVAAVRHVEKLLLFVGRKRDVKRGTFGGFGWTFDVNFLNELAVELKYLYTVVDAITYSTLGTGRRFWIHTAPVHGTLLHVGRYGNSHLSGGGPLGAALKRQDETGTLHGLHVMSQSRLEYPA